MKVFLITAFEPIPTDNIRPMRFMGIAEKFLEKGHDVTIITSSFTPHNNSHRFSEDKNIKLSENYNLKILKSKGYDKKISIKRYFAHLDFANKLKIALKEAEEVEYWLDIIDETRNYDLTDLYSQTDEVIRLLVSIIKKTSSNS